MTLPNPFGMRPLKNPNQLESLVDFFQIPDWDAIIVADGSGSRWNYPMGWAAVLIDRATNQRKLITGASNVGTNQLAELRPFVDTLEWYSNKHGPGATHLRALRAAGDSRDLLIHCISDSEVTVKQGNGVYQQNDSIHWWNMLAQLSARGYKLKFHWLRRNLCGLNRICDSESKRMRMGLQEVQTLIESTQAVSEEMLEEIQLTRPNIYEDGWNRPPRIKNTSKESDSGVSGNST